MDYCLNLLGLEGLWSVGQVDDEILGFPSSGIVRYWKVSVSTFFTEAVQNIFRPTLPNQKSISAFPVFFKCFCSCMAYYV